MAKGKKWITLSDVARANHQVPKSCGIYMFVELNTRTKKKRPIYIGKSSELHIRLKLRHEVEREWYRSVGVKSLVKYLFLHVLLCDDFDTKEVHYIKKFKPHYNIVHNTNVRRVVKVKYVKR